MDDKEYIVACSGYFVDLQPPSSSYYIQPEEKEQSKGLVELGSQDFQDDMDRIYKL